MELPKKRLYDARNPDLKSFHWLPAKSSEPFDAEKGGLCNYDAFILDAIKFNDGRGPEYWVVTRDGLMLDNTNIKNMPSDSIKVTEVKRYKLPDDSKDVERVAAETTKQIQSLNLAKTDVDTLV